LGQSSQPILLNPGPATYVRSKDGSRGYLAFNPPNEQGLAHESFMVQSFDVRRLRLTGEPVAVPLAIAGALGNGAVALVFSFANGAMAYCTNGTGRYQSVWYDRTGKLVGTVGEPSDIGDIGLSPDGSQAAYHDRGGMDDLWLFDFARGLSTRFTFSPNRDHQAVWSPDSHQIIWARQKDRQQSLYLKASNGTGEERLVTDGEPGSFNVPDDWSPDGRFFLYAAGRLGPAEGPGGALAESWIANGVGRNVWALPLKPDGTPSGPAGTYLDNPLGVGHARFSPNGRWVAYSIGTPDGVENIYVSPFPIPKASEERWAISSNGGYQPLWTREGKELLYLAGDGTIMSVQVDTAGAEFRSGSPKPLFPVRIAGGASAAPTHRWDVSKDGQRFVVVTVLDVTQSAPINVVTDWESGLKH
jgi:hypothetical protein